MNELYKLKPCEECKGTGDAHHQGHDYDCGDCLGTGYEEPAKRIMNLESELTAARQEIERLGVVGIHSCHDQCQRPNCVLRRELEASRAEIELLKTNLEISFRQTEQAVQDRADEHKMLIEQRDKLMVSLWKCRERTEP